MPCRSSTGASFPDSTTHPSLPPLQTRPAVRPTLLAARPVLDAVRSTLDNRSSHPVSPTLTHGCHRPQGRVHQSRQLQAPAVPARGNPACGAPAPHREAGKRPTHQNNVSPFVLEHCSTRYDAFACAVSDSGVHQSQSEYRDHITVVLYSSPSAHRMTRLATKHIVITAEGGSLVSIGSST